jgi:hypothetical protein
MSDEIDNLRIENKLVQEQYEKLESKLQKINNEKELEQLQ